MTTEKRIVVFSDLDGTLLDHTSYSFEPSLPALAALREKNIPLILCTSKTRAEIEPLRRLLANTHPFIPENGGAVFIPRGCFHFPFPFTWTVKGYSVIELGSPYSVLRRALGEIRSRCAVSVRGFGDMTVREVAELCGFTPADARRARMREYDEPFLIDDKGRQDDIRRCAASLGLRLTEGGRFHHLTGKNDKGEAVRILKRLYSKESGDILAVGLGDSANDLPLLREVDIPVLVQKPDESYDPSVVLEGLLKAPGPGPRGWNRAVLDLLERPS
jgi:mannosyl-3-phosphoglycerate phosphatase